MNVYLYIHIINIHSTHTCKQKRILDVINFDWSFDSTNWNIYKYMKHYICSDWLWFEGSVFDWLHVVFCKVKLQTVVHSLTSVLRCRKARRKSVFPVPRGPITLQRNTVRWLCLFSRSNAFSLVTNIHTDKDSSESVGSNRTVRGSHYLWCRRSGTRAPLEWDTRGDRNAPNTGGHPDKRITCGLFNTSNLMP